GAVAEQDDSANAAAAQDGSNAELMLLSSHAEIVHVLSHGDGNTPIPAPGTSQSAGTVREERGPASGLASAVRDTSSLVANAVTPPGTNHDALDAIFAQDDQDSLFKAV